MFLLPDLQIARLRMAYDAREQAPFDEVGQVLGVELRVIELTRALRIVVRPDLYTMVPELVRAIYAALASPHGYGFRHVVQSGCRIYTCLVVRDGARLVASVQPSFPRTAFPNPGWKMTRWNPDEPARHAKALATWARDPERTRDAGFFRITGSLPRATPDLAGDVRGELRDLAAQIERMDLRDPARTALREREAELVRGHEQLIAGGIDRIAESYTIARGALDRATILATRLVRDVPVLLAASPRRVRIVVDNEDAWEPLVESDVLAQIADLEIAGRSVMRGKVREVDVAMIARTRLACERLAFLYLRAPEDAWPQMLRSLDAPALRSIRIDGGNFGPAGIAALAAHPDATDIDVRSPWMHGSCDPAMFSSIASRPNLRALALGWFCDEPDAAITMALRLAASLRDLVLVDDKLTDAVIDPLAQFLETHSLEHLELSVRKVSDAAFARLIRSPGFAKVAHASLNTYGRDPALIGDALLACRARQRITVSDPRMLSAAVHEHVDRVEVRDDGSFDRVVYSEW